MRLAGAVCGKCGTDERYARSGECVACVRAYNAAHYQANRAARDAKSKEWVKAHPGATRAYAKTWQSRNPDQHVLITRQSNYARRAEKLAAYQDGSVTLAVLAELRKSDTCFYCNAALGEGEVHLDHRIPLRAYGAPHCAWNLVPSCEGCNGGKNDVFDIATVLDVVATPGGEVWGQGPGRAWLAHVAPLLWDGPKRAQDIFPTAA